MADKLAHGTHNRGRSKKLTEAQVLAIRSLRGKLSQPKIADMFGVARPTIASIHSGTNWGWL